MNSPRRRLRNRLALTTILTVAPFLSYGRQAFAACDLSTAPTILCSGSETTTQNIPVDNADVSTAPGFSVNAAGNGIAITGDGHLRFTDDNASTMIQGTEDGLYVKSGTFGTASPGGVTIRTNGTINGGSDGIYARNYGSGGVEITTEAASNVTGGRRGIHAENYGTGDVEITVKGDVTGESNYGIYAFNSINGRDLKVTTGAGATITGGVNGINASNVGSGNLEITADGDVEGQEGYGIYAFNSYYSGELKVITGAGSAVAGYSTGIRAVNESTGDLTITANGAVTGMRSSGIYAKNSSYFGRDGRDLTITTGEESAITGGYSGINARNFGTGDLEITANGDVMGQSGFGISAYTSSSGQNVTVTTGEGSDVRGGYTGIRASSNGSGALDIIANGAVSGNIDGISAYLSTNGTSLTVTTGAASGVSSNGDGIDVVSNGSADLEVTVHGTASGQGGSGIRSFKGGSGGANLIGVGATGAVQGYYAGIYAASAKSTHQDIVITNDGLVGNLSGQSYDRAILARNGATTINNNGDLIGTVSLDTDTGFDDVVNNSGAWNTTGGVSNFAGGNDTVNNRGALIAAADGTSLEATALTNLETFNNSGLVSLADGGEGDSLVISGPTNFVGNGGRLAVDAALAPGGSSDVLIITGNSSGVTNLVVNPTNPQTITPNFEGITMVVVSGTTAQGDFDVEGGVLNTGFFAWDVRLDDGGENWHELYTTGLGAGAYEFAAGISGAQDIWRQTAGTLLQRQADLRALLDGTGVTPVADYAEPVTPTPVARITPGFWFNGFGAYIDRDDEEDGVVLDRQQTVWGGLAGFDFGTEHVGDALIFGIFGGYLTSALDFDATNTEWTYEGPSLGVYATYLDHAFHADVTVKADFLDVDIDAEDIAPGQGEADTDVFNIGGQVDLGYKVPLHQGLFIEPQAALAVIHTEIDDIDDIFGGAVEFDDETSVRGRLGLRLGHEIVASGGVTYSGDVTGSLWQEFNGENDATVFAPDFPVTSVSDDAGETFGDVSLGFSVQSPDGWSSFLRGNWLFNEDVDALSANAGLRYAW